MIHEKYYIKYSDDITEEIFKQITSTLGVFVVHLATLPNTYEAFRRGGYIRVNDQIRGNDQEKMSKGVYPHWCIDNNEQSLMVQKPWKEVLEYVPKKGDIFAVDHLETKKIMICRYDTYSDSTRCKGPIVSDFNGIEGKFEFNHGGCCFILSDRKVRPATNDEISWLSDCIEANELVKTKFWRDDVLPEKWCIRYDNEEQSKILNTYFKKYEFKFTGEERGFDYSGRYVSDIQSVIDNGCTEITFDLFKKRVLKQEIIPSGIIPPSTEVDYVGRWFKCLHGNANGCEVNDHSVKKGEYVQIEKVVGDKDRDILEYKLKNGNFLGFVGDDDQRFRDRGFEVMPKEWIPYYPPINEYPMTPKECKPPRNTGSFSVGTKIIFRGKKGTILGFSEDGGITVCEGEFGSHNGDMLEYWNDEYGKPIPYTEGTNRYYIVLRELQIDNTVGVVSKLSGNISIDPDPSYFTFTEITMLYDDSSSEITMLYDDSSSDEPDVSLYKSSKSSLVDSAIIHVKPVKVNLVKTKKVVLF